MTEARRQAFRYGRLAEGLCVWWLRLKGFSILARDFRCPVGEIDIVARRGRLVVFAEVKARADREAAAETLSPRQRRRIERAAELFLARHPALGGKDLRFDLLLVEPWRPPRHIADAWRPEA
ncbi:MAG: YraN family protein [Magnetospirillum sp. WYHS-4]